MCSTSSSYAIWIIHVCIGTFEFFSLLNGEYKRTHSLQNYQRNSVFRLSCHFASALLFGNKTRKRFKDTLSNKLPGTSLIIPRVCHCFLISFKTAFIVHVVMGNFLAWTRLWFLVLVVCLLTTFHLCLCGLILYEFLTFCTGHFLNHTPYRVLWAINCRRLSKNPVACW